MMLEREGRFPNRPTGEVGRTGDHKGRPYGGEMAGYAAVVGGHDWVAPRRGEMGVGLFSVGDLLS